MEDKTLKILLQLVASATLADHMGDMWDDLGEALKKVGRKDLEKLMWVDDENHELAHQLAKEGITTIWGTEVASIPCEVEDCEFHSNAHATAPIK